MTLFLDWLVVDRYGFIGRGPGTQCHEPKLLFLKGDSKSSSLFLHEAEVGAVWRQSSA